MAEGQLLMPVMAAPSYPQNTVRNYLHAATRPVRRAGPVAQSRYAYSTGGDSRISEKGGNDYTQSGLGSTRIAHGHHQAAAGVMLSAAAGEGNRLAAHRYLASGTNQAITYVFMGVAAFAVLGAVAIMYKNSKK